MIRSVSLSLLLLLPSIAGPAAARPYPDYAGQDGYYDERWEEEVPPVHWDEAPADKQARGSRLLRSVMLKSHNDARRDMGQPPLRWNATLAADAQRYANQLARTRIFRHSREPRGHTPQGENLWMGSSGYFSYDEMTASWTNERRWFRRAALPRFSTTGRWADVAHYTQIIWHSTTDLGCAIADNGKDEYLVCRYGPPGNVYGRDPLGGDEPPRPVRSGY